jgi:hypothetical protein
VLIMINPIIFTRTRDGRRAGKKHNLIHKRTVSPKEAEAGVSFLLRHLDRRDIRIQTGLCPAPHPHFPSAAESEVPQ